MTFLALCQVINLSRSRKNEIFKFKITKNRFKIGSYENVSFADEKN